MHAQSGTHFPLVYRLFHHLDIRPANLIRHALEVGRAGVCIIDDIDRLLEAKAEAAV
jgi:hypothetical protein